MWKMQYYDSRPPEGTPTAGGRCPGLFSTRLSPVEAKAGCSASAEGVGVRFGLR